jgi:hypothetical protein
MTDKPARLRLPPSREMLRAGWPMHYILVGQTPIAVDLWTWAEDVERRSRSIRDGNGDPWRVGRTELTDACHVSTVFMGRLTNSATTASASSRRE